jgi:hypothetical protein
MWGRSQDEGCADSMRRQDLIMGRIKRRHRRIKLDKTFSKFPPCERDHTAQRDHRRGCAVGVGHRPRLRRLNCNA